MNRAWSDQVDRILSKVLEAEGGFVNHPSDPGGATNKGITFRTFRSVYGRSATLGRLKLLTDHEAKTIYWRKYVKAYNLDTIADPAVQHLAIDFSIHSGTAAIKHLRLAAVISPAGKTQYRLDEDDITIINNKDAFVLANLYLHARAAYLSRVISYQVKKGNTGYIQFRKGFQNRINKLANLYGLKEREIIYPLPEV